MIRIYFELKSKSNACLLNSEFERLGYSCKIIKNCIWIETESEIDQDYIINHDTSFLRLHDVNFSVSSYYPDDEDAEYIDNFLLLTN